MDSTKNKNNPVYSHTDTQKHTIVQGGAQKWAAPISKETLMAQKC